MSETYYAGGYWGPRQESPEGCAQRLEDFLRGLSSIDSSFAHWYETAKSPKASLKRPLWPDHGELTRLVQRSKDPVFDDLGFSVGGWNGQPLAHEDCGFLLRCGSYDARTHNRCVFSLPSRGASADRVLTAPVLSSMLRETAAAWAPDWGVAMSHAHRDMADSHRVPKSPYVGWVTYLAQHRGPVPPLPAPVRVEPVEGKGTLIVLTPERFTASNPEHVALAERVRVLLDQAGLLKPLQA
ncbi:immunity 52 family protein [Myxococcus guangdongensis]|uniref:immunity 52 family protein n=1 Tax=Myxococcus guangdongensis TaxID=2906760 RepID=UPI002B21AE13|nr:immunity 52 family protein [Myxococcus guangdongensis]